MSDLICYSSRNTVTNLVDCGTELAIGCDYERFLWELRPAICLSWIAHRWGYTTDEIAETIFPMYGYRTPNRATVALWVRQAYEKLEKTMKKGGRWYERCG